MVVIIYLMTIEDKVRKEKKEGGSAPATFKRQKRVTGEDGNIKYVDFTPETRAPYESKTTPESEYKRVVGSSAEKGSKILSENYMRSLGQRARTAIGNVKNIANNAVDTVVGRPISSMYNWQTRRFLKKNPEAKQEIWYTEHGSAQGKHNQWRLMREGRKQGKLMYGLSANHSKGHEHTTDQSFDQIYNLHKKTGLKNPERRRDKYMGHSSGANTGLYMATDPRIKGTGIKEVHGVAATPHGIAADTIERRLMGLVTNIDYDRKDKAKGQKAATELYKRGKPFVDVYMSTGKADGLVKPEDINYRHAKGMKVIDHKDSTHFGTSGSNSRINKILVDMMANPDKHYKPVSHYTKEKAA